MDEIKFLESAGLYKETLKDIEFDDLYVHGKYSLNALLSLAPLSRAVHDLGKEMYVELDEAGERPVLIDVWDAYSKLAAGESGPVTDALKAFIAKASEKMGPLAEIIFTPPSLILEAEDVGFSGKNLRLGYAHDWFSVARAEELAITAQKIIDEVISPKNDESMGVSFALVPGYSNNDEKLRDYLDSYAITDAVVRKSIGKTKNLRISSSTNKPSLLDEPERASELKATLIGCEMSKAIDEPVFKAYSKLSGSLGLDRLQPNEAVFGIRGKGYHGRHHFGEKIGYPTPDKKTRWDSPGSMAYKFSWYPQSHIDPRKPKSRIGFTSTVPLDVFIDSVNVDYKEMRARNHKIKAELDRSDKVIIRSNIPGGSEFEVGLKREDGRHREVRGSDSDARHLCDPDHLKEGNSFGMMANIPGGEAFTTPEYVKGRIVGDVVINIDKSYTLDGKDPMIIEVEQNKYKIISGPKQVLDKMEEKRRDSWKRLEEQETTGAVPKEIIELKKKNFDNIGEFAVNTNPKARLCDYLIVNEKIANMIHIALGSGFEPDKASEYHCDIVIDSPRQKLDIYGIDGSGNEHWIIKEGWFVI